MHKLIKISSVLALLLAGQHVIAGSHAEDIIAETAEMAKQAEVFKQSTPQATAQQEKVEAATQPAVTKTTESGDIKIFINRVAQPYEILKKIRTEVYVVDVGSEEEAELKAYITLKSKALEQGADGLIEVRRYVYKDGIALGQAIAAPTGSSGIMRDDIDSTGVSLDDLTLDEYERGKGTLSSRRIDATFDYAKYSQKSIVFTGKAIRFQSK